VIVVDPDGTLHVLAGGLPGTIGNEGDGGDPLLARFVEPAGLEITDDGTIYVADRTANRIRVIKDGIIDSLAGTGIAGYEGDGGPAKTAMLTQPTGLATDAAGNLYVSDTGNCAIRRIAPDGTISTIAGSGIAGFGGDGGPANRALLAHPDGVAVAPDGSLYIGDGFNNRVRRVGVDGTIATIAGTGEKGIEGDGGPGLEAQFGRVSRVQLDSDGNLLIADQTNSIVRKLFVSEVR
jgi:sugar lactone lactonase YvrE